ncbi:MAG TPA: LysR substrate-binding domain-containing protein [Asticcacaulis sp.]|nr:LysR substrate-binding domain-containing protein [Asticcacaulis sp.]HTM79772.1 LysR substrate-binding domain-containing protein [Asticcacaulis sp.]
MGARFAMAYPEVQLEIVAEDRKVDPVEDGYDLVIRIDPSPDERLIGRSFLHDRRVVVAPVNMPKPKDSPSDVKAVVLSAVPAGATWPIITAEGDVVLAPCPVLRLSSLLMVREAVLAGAGAALLPSLLVADDIDAGRLAYWGTQAGPPVEIWALQSSRRLIGAKVRAFLDVLEATFPKKAFTAPSV